MPSLAAHFVAYAATAILATAPGSDAPELPACEPGEAHVTGAPAPELFSPDQAARGFRAAWCERYTRDGRSQRSGPYVDWYPSGAERTRARFVEDQLDGEVVVRHERGEVWLVSHYRRGALDGRYAMYRPDGTPWLVGWFRDGLMDGRQTSYHADGSVASEVTYVAGLEQGVGRAFWPGGVLRRERDFVDGVPDGRFASWYPNGRLESEGHYAPCAGGEPDSTCPLLGAARHGRWQSWHENGERASQGQYRYGAKVGTWVYWNEQGEPELVDVHPAGRGGIVHSIRGTPPVSSPGDTPLVADRAH